jgi:hypothetical protein
MHQARYDRIVELMDAGSARDSAGDSARDGTTVHSEEGGTGNTTAGVGEGEGEYESEDQGGGQGGQGGGVDLIIDLETAAWHLQHRVLFMQAVCPRPSSTSAWCLKHAVECFMKAQQAVSDEEALGILLRVDVRFLNAARYIPADCFEGVRAGYVFKKGVGDDDGDGERCREGEGGVGNEDGDGGGGGNAGRSVPKAGDTVTHLSAAGFIPTHGLGDRRCNKLGYYLDRDQMVQMCRRGEGAVKPDQRKRPSPRMAVVGLAGGAGARVEAGKAGGKDGGGEGGSDGVHEGVLSTDEALEQVRQWFAVLRGEGSKEGDGRK